MENVVVFDLDDTLYNEIDFLKSGYNYIASLYFADKKNIIFEEMYNFYQNKENVFEKIISKYEIAATPQELIELYRNHFPNIKLDPEEKELFIALKAKSYKLGLITDGFSKSQRNKLTSLGILDYFDKIIISEEFGTSKPCLNNFKIFEDIYPNSIYNYIADNPVKDFITPNNLNWQTFMKLDNGNNIHPQNIKVKKNYAAKIEIKKLSEILAHIN